MDINPNDEHVVGSLLRELTDEAIEGTLDIVISHLKKYLRDNEDVFSIEPAYKAGFKVAVELVMASKRNFKERER